LIVLGEIGLYLQPFGIGGEPPTSFAVSDPERLGLAPHRNGAWFGLAGAALAGDHLRRESLPLGDVGGVLGELVDPLVIGVGLVGLDMPKLDPARRSIGCTLAFPKSDIHRPKAKGEL